MQEGELTLEGGCDPSWFYRLLDSLGFLVDSSGSMISVCTLTSQLWSSCVLILCNLPDVSLSHWSINTCYKILETTRNTTKLGKKIKIS